MFISVGKPEEMWIKEENFSNKSQPVDIWIFCSYLPLNVSLMVANNSVYVMSWPLWLTCNVDADYCNHEHGIDDEDGGDDNDGGDGGGLQLRVRHVMPTLSHL